MKTILQRLMCIAITAMTCMSVNAQVTSGSCGDDATWEYDSGTLTISGTGAMADYTDALTDNPWDTYRTSITKVVIGNSITHIGNWTFMGCSALTEVTIGDHVTSIGAEAFANCLNEDFKYLAIPASVENIGAFALSNIKYLEYIACYASTAPTLGAEALTILNNLVAIYVPTAKVANYQAASGWSDLSAKITYPHGNCGDGEPATDAVTWAFDMASGTMTLTGSGAVKTFSDQNPMAYPWNSDEAAVWNPTGMDGNAWRWMGITSLVIGEGITNLPDYSFGMHIHLTSVTLPSTLTSIGASSLEECAFTSITLPEGLEVINGNAFLSSKFTSLTLPSTLTTIGRCAFNDCQYLTSITIPANVTSIGEEAFLNCIALETVTMLRATPPTLGEKAFYDYNDVIIPALTAINVPDANVQDYKTATNWSDYAALIAGGGAPAATTTFTYTATEKVTAFDTYANFTGATGVISHDFADGAGTVVYEGTVTAIATNAVAGSYYSPNTILTGVVIPSGVETIGIGAFSYCRNLASVTLPDDLETLDQGCFAYTKIASITIPDQVENINAAAFMGCTSLTTIDIPNSVTFLGNNIFLGCSKLESATLGSGITAISRKLFDNCVKLESIVIPNGVTIIGAEAFMGCTGLKTVTIGSGVTEIEDGSTNGYDEAFRDCSAVTDVYCYASPATMTWAKNSNTTIFKSSKATLFHVADADAWSTKFPDANVTFVGDLAPTVTGNAVDGVYWATYYNSGANMKADANTTVYKAAINGSSLTLTEVDDKVINAGQAVILKSDAASIAMTTSAAASAADYSDNALEGVDVAEPVDANYNYYVLSNEGSTLGFYKYIGATLGANKAFIKVADTGAPEFYAFDFGGNTTGVNGVRSKTTDVNGTVYNLNGQRVDKPTKGLYIVNGKLVIIK